MRMVVTTRKRFLCCRMPSTFCVAVGLLLLLLLLLGPSWCLQPTLITGSSQRRLQTSFPNKGGLPSFQFDPVRTRRLAGLLEASSHSHRDDDGEHTPTTSTTTEASSASSDPTPLVRLNKVFKATHSRREADRLVQLGRVTVNGEVSLGDMVVPFRDVVALDGQVVHGWEQMNGIVGREWAEVVPSSFPATTGNFEYVKYYKPLGVICTTDRRVHGNIIDALTGGAGGGYRPRHRVYPVGRLDRDSSGLILLTSDGRLPNASLRRRTKQPKVYHVTVDPPLSEADLECLRLGVVITTVAQRDGTSKPLTARTRPCAVTRLGTAGRTVEIVLEEGRNRQIRRMVAALGHEVTKLHRIRFGGIALDPDMSAGDWKELNSEELRWIESILEQSDAEGGDDTDE